ncbi:MAG: PaaI family thioesterase [Polaromonas sp.]|uniref:PaaI family thioesterase n=1 Tax=Polaromonas sp. TaxID=1869339 RepID=UPI0027356A82|nr:PaaI family thioesterase [Polaromonas sp.]MDP3796253.1 PaaI family thioesterase [Polaromonas sp.]
MNETLLLQKGQAFLALQPFSVLRGAELHGLKRGHCELHVPVNPKILQQNGFVHGGMVSYAADNAPTYAGETLLDWAVVTSEFKINDVRPAIGERLIARAEAGYAGKTQAACRCDVFVVVNGVEKLCAVAQGTIARLPVKSSQT